MSIVISHIHEESGVAGRIQKALQNSFPDTPVWVSSIDQRYGVDWLKEVHDRFTKAKVLLVLCSPQSIRRPWINIETGIGAAGDGKLVIPILHRGLRRDGLEPPLSTRQSLSLGNRSEIKRLFDDLANALHRENLAIDLSPLFADPPPRESKIGVVTAQAQSSWPRGNEASIFAPPENIAGALCHQFHIEALNSSEMLTAESLATFLQG